MENLPFNEKRQETVHFTANLAINSKISNNESMLQAIASAGIDTLCIGLESGSEKIRHDVLRRPKYNNQNLYDFSHLARSHSIKINLYVLLGIPGETAEDFRQTVAVCRQCQPNWVFLAFYHPYPGTDLYEASLPFKRHSNRRKSADRYYPALDLPEFSTKQMIREFILFHYNVFKGTMSRTALIRNVVENAGMVFPALQFLSKMLEYLVNLKVRLRPLLKRSSA